MYDVIGDIHGHHEALEALLRRLGYTTSGGSWRYPGNTRKAVFIGDYIDRGPDSPAVIAIVRRMVETDSAIALMGNHEYNAILWHTRDEAGTPLRSHSEAHRRQHQATLDAFARRTSPVAGTAESGSAAESGNAAESIRNAVDWMRTLPLYYEDESIRAVHAAWDSRAIAALPTAPSALTDDRFLHRSAIPGTPEHRAVETLLKGIEIPIPEGRAFFDKEGTRRTRTRIRWWESPGTDPIPFRRIALPPADTELPDLLVPADSIPAVGYSDTRPVFVGHYWLTGIPRPLTDRVACVDYSIALGGHLCAYRYDGDLPLREDRFVCLS